MNLNKKSYIINTEYSEKSEVIDMTSKKEFLQQLEELEGYYDKLDEDNKNKLGEAIQMVVTKFEKRVI